MESQHKQEEGAESTNFIEIRAYGLMRSGNHAIIDWIQSQYSGYNTCFLNNVKHGDYDPYTNASRRILTNIDEQIDTESLRKLKKRLLIYSYEDREHLENQDVDFLSSVFQHSFDINRKSYVGDSRHRFDVLIIRDPFNLFASRLKLLETRGTMGGVGDMTLIAHNWKILARKALSLMEHPKPGDIIVNYNRWVVDKNYRKNLSQKLLGGFNDSSLHRVPVFGGGSSFSEMAIEKLTIKEIVLQAYKLFDIRRYGKIGHYLKRLTATGEKPQIVEKDFKPQLFERWKLFADDENYRKLFSDNEIISLSEELFGEIKGTREFVKSLSE